MAPAGSIGSSTASPGGGLIEFFDYTLDANGDRTSVESTAGRGHINPLRQLERVAYPDGREVSYSYDALANASPSRRAAPPSRPATTTRRASRTWARSRTSTTTPGISFVAGSTTFGWDWRGRLATVSNGISYGYDGDDVRISATAASTTANLLYDRLGWSSYPNSCGNGYVHGPEGFLAQTGAGTAYAHTDALGSPRVLTDGSGAVAGRRAFDALGAISDETGATSRLGFTGAQQESRLVHLNARDLSTATGRFLSVDPVRPGAPGVTGWNQYTYVGNNPTGWVDPSGLQPAVDTALILRNLGAVGLASLATRRNGFSLYLQECVAYPTRSRVWRRDPPSG